MRTRLEIFERQTEIPYKVSEMPFDEKRAESICIRQLEANMTEEKIAPVLSGNISDQNRKEVDQVALWENQKQGVNQPVYTGTVKKPDGTKLRISIWRTAKKSEGGDSDL